MICGSLHVTFTVGELACLSELVLGHRSTPLGSCLLCTAIKAGRLLLVKSDPGPLCQSPPSGPFPAPRAPHGSSPTTSQSSPDGGVSVSGGPQTACSPQRKKHITLMSSHGHSGLLARKARRWASYLVKWKFPRRVGRSWLFEVLLAPATINCIP